jgi:glycosyltransferase involved in cell wall biosynthesis
MIAPERFREGGMQDLECAPNNPRNPQLTALPVKRFHTQAVWFGGLLKDLRHWLQKPAHGKVYLCFAEPYSITALWGWMTLCCARAFTGFSGPKPLFLLYGFQNIYKRFPLPLRVIQSLMFRVTDGIFVAGKEHESVLRQQGYQGPCVNLPMWFDPEVFSPSSTTYDGDVRIGYAGSLLAEKGITQLLDTLIEHPGTLTGCSLDVAGGGQLKDEISAKISCLNAKGVTARFLGSVSSPEMAGFYRGIDILIVPSRTAQHWKEQFGRVIIEAMASGVVVIGSDSGEIPVVIADPDRVFPENDMMRLREVLTLAARRVRAGRSDERMKVSLDATNRFADHKVARQLASDVERLLNAHERRPST